MTTTTRSSWYIRFSAMAAMLLTITIVRYPQTAFHASLQGLKIWFEIVLPALLPFFAMSEILMGLGVVHFIGVFMEPLMRPLFRLPGTGAFAVAMGLASGYPIGAKITGQLRREGLCTSSEGARLVALANTADPLFMVGAVAVGMFGVEEVGWTIAAAHYLAVLTVGFLLRFYPDPPSPGAHSFPKKSDHKKNVLSRALGELESARMGDGRPFGQLFGDAIKDSFTSMLFVGGCIMVFSVLSSIADVAGITGALQTGLQVVFRKLNLDVGTIPSIVRGFIEITIGCEAASHASSSLFWRAVTASLIIGWSGLSVHAQVAAMVHGTGIRLAPYMLARAAHGILAALFTAALWRPLAVTMAKETLTPLARINQLGILSRLSLSLFSAAAVVSIIMAIGLVMALIRGIRITILRIR